MMDTGQEHNVCQCEVQAFCEHVVQRRQVGGFCFSDVGRLSVGRSGLLVYCELREGHSHSQSKKLSPWPGLRSLSLRFPTVTLAVTGRSRTRGLEGKVSGVVLFFYFFT